MKNILVKEILSESDKFRLSILNKDKSPFIFDLSTLSLAIKNEDDDDEYWDNGNYLLGELYHWVYGIIEDIKLDEAFTKDDKEELKSLFDDAIEAQFFTKEDIKIIYPKNVVEAIAFVKDTLVGEKNTLTIRETLKLLKLTTGYNLTIDEIIENYYPF